jgi:hypothetical protein
MSWLSHAPGRAGPINRRHRINQLDRLAQGETRACASAAKTLLIALAVSSALDTADVKDLRRPARRQTHARGPVRPCRSAGLPASIPGPQTRELFSTNLRIDAALAGKQLSTRGADMCRRAEFGPRAFFLSPMGAGVFEATAPGGCRPDPARSNLSSDPSDRRASRKFSLQKRELGRAGFIWAGREGQQRVDTGRRRPLKNSPIFVPNQRVQKC